MFHCLNGYGFFIKIVPVDGRPREKKEKKKKKKEFLYSAVFTESTLKQCELFLARVVTRFVVLKSFWFLGVINLFDLIGVRNSFAGIAGISPLTTLAKNESTVARDHNIAERYTAPH